MQESLLSLLCTPLCKAQRTQPRATAPAQPAVHGPTRTPRCTLPSARAQARGAAEVSRATA